MVTYIYVVMCENSLVRAFASDTLAKMYLDRHRTDTHDWRIEVVDFV